MKQHELEMIEEELRDLNELKCRMDRLESGNQERPCCSVSDNYVDEAAKNMGNLLPKTPLLDQLYKESQEVAPEG